MCRGKRRNDSVAAPGGARIVNFFVGIGLAAGSEHGTICVFSGHWMLFYGTAFCVFQSAWRQPRLLVRAQCPAGHDVRRGNRYCPDCGLPVAPAEGALIRNSFRLATLFFLKMRFL